MIDLFYRMKNDRKLLQALKQRIYDEVFQGKPCIENDWRSRTPKLAIPQSANPKIAVTLNVMHHIIRCQQHKIVIMSDTGDKMVLPSLLENDMAEKYFTQYFSHWFYIFDAPSIQSSVLERIWAAQVMEVQLRDLQT